MQFKNKVLAKYEIKLTNNYDWDFDLTPDKLSENFQKTLLTSTDKQTINQLRLLKQYATDKIFRTHSIRR